MKSVKGNRICEISPQLVEHLRGFATTVPARVMKLDKELGTIQSGKLADLIIVDGNPLEDISLIRNVRAIVKDGRIYDSATLWKAIGFIP